MKINGINLLRYSVLFAALSTVALNILEPTITPSFRSTYETQELANASNLGKATYIIANNKILKDKDLVLVENFKDEYMNSYDYFWGSYWLYPSKVILQDANYVLTSRPEYVLSRNSDADPLAYSVIYVFGSGVDTWTLYKRINE